MYFTLCIFSAGLRTEEPFAMLSGKTKLGDGNSIFFVFFFCPPPPPPQRDNQRQTEGADTNQEPHDANLVSSAHATLHYRYSMPTIKINKVTNKPYKNLQRIHIIGDLVHIETVIS